MLQQDLLPPPTAPEPRSKRSEIAILPILRDRMRAVAAEYDVSVNEVLVQCLVYGLGDELVIRLIERAAIRKRELAGAAQPPEQNSPVSFLLPESVKSRLKALKKQHGLHFNEIVTVCLQHGLFDQLVLHRIKSFAATRIKKVGRTVRKEDVHQAA